MARAELLQLGEYVPLQGIELVLKGRECRTDEDSNNRPVSTLVVDYPSRVSVGKHRLENLSVGQALAQVAQSIA